MFIQPPGAQAAGSEHRDNGQCAPTKEATTRNGNAQCAPTREATMRNGNAQRAQTREATTRNGNAQRAQTKEAITHNGNAQRAPKGQYSIAQGNALGINRITAKRPVRAKVSEHFCPYRAQGGGRIFPGRCPGLWSVAPSGRIGRSRLQIHHPNDYKSMEYGFEFWRTPLRYLHFSAAQNSRKIQRRNSRCVFREFWACSRNRLTMCGVCRFCMKVCNKDSRVKPRFRNK